MKARLHVAALALVVAPALAAPVWAAPVEVTRFHTPESITALGRGAISVVAAPGMDAASLEMRTWLQAVEAELSALRFAAATPGAADAVAEVRVEREVQRIANDTGRQRGPVSVGIGGSTGGWNSGVGLGIGFSFGGGPKVRMITRLVVTIRSRATGLSLWEGRADNTEREKSRAASVDQAAPRLAHALFSGFPGTSGATITVK